MSQAQAISAEAAGGIRAYDPALDAPAHHHPIFDYDSGPPVDRGKFAIWLFLATEVMFFTGLIGTYVVLRLGTPAWPDPEQRLAVGVTAGNTFLLITSSWFMVRALHAIQRGDNGGLLLWLIFVWIGAARGKFSAQRYLPVELAGLYWHFVDLVWVLLFTIVYLM